MRPEPRSIGRDDPDYPEGLRDLPDRPASIFVRGVWPVAREAIAVVGSRAASPYGAEQAGRLAADLARLGYPVVSGLARGIDAAAHRGTLSAGGATVAVLPGGLDAITPRHHRGLAEEIALQGALLSEVPSGGPRFRGDFVRRNRLIAALARATVVVEAAEASGALHTAAAARRLGRPVLAVPGDIDRPTSRGCHRLIRGGAKLCESARDVVDALGPSAGPPGGPEGRLLAVLAQRPEAVEHLARRSGLAVEAALAALLGLEWAGVATSHPGQRWSRTSRVSR